MRKKLRSLVKLIDKAGRVIVYTDFEDVIGNESSIEMPGFGAGVDVDRFRAKARQFLKQHENEPVIHKLRFNETLGAEDLASLEKMLISAGAGSPEEIAEVKAMSNGLGLFIRSLVGLDRSAAKRAFEGFLGERKLTANQIEFVNLVIDHLTQSGWLDPSRLYETPFIDFSPRGVEGVFRPDEVTQLIAILNGVRQSAAA